MVGNRSSLLQVKVIPKSIIYGEKQRAGRPRPYDDEGFMGLRGLCVVGIVYCLNQDFQDYRIFRIGRGLYTFRMMSIIRYYDVFFNEKSVDVIYFLEYNDVR